MKKITILTCCALALAGCVAKNEVKMNIDPNLNGNFALKSMLNEPVKSDISLNIDTKQMIFAGSDGCNNILGNIDKIDGNKLVFGAVASTKMLCEDMKLADKFINVFGQTKGFSVDKNTLLLKDASGKTILEFTRN